MLRTDVLIIGSEGAGAGAAIEALRCGAEVVMVTKGRFGHSGATITGGADINVDSRSAKELLGLPGDPRDSVDCFFEDMVVEGKYINNQRLVEAHVQEAPIRVRELVDMGVKITNFMHGPGHRYPRGVYISGADMIKVFKRQLERTKVKIVEDVMITDLLIIDGRVVGAVGLDLCRGEFISIAAGAVILATGGGMRLYPVTTAPEELTGDGQAMAWRAGAELVDMEMVQFLPCTFVDPPAWLGLTFPFLIGPGVGGMEGWLLNKYGYRFMRDWDPQREERTTRDILAIAIMNEVVEGRGSPSGGVYLSFAHLPYNLIERYPIERKDAHLKPDWTFKGFSLRSLVEEIKRGYAMEVGPASHFFMGGIRINERCETTLEGLYAAGEVAGGLHGANRLTGNAFTQIVVQGARAGQFAAAYAKGIHHREVDPRQARALQDRIFSPIQRDSGVRSYDLKKQLQKLAWESAGVLRNGLSLESTLAHIQGIWREAIPRSYCAAKQREYNREWIECLQIENLLTLLEAISHSALTRTESRGAHYRKDFPGMDNHSWLKNVVIENRDGQMRHRLEPVVITRLEPPRE
ncbi:MAG: FAD-binding protein [Chloroflexi bacterium]|nr:FAD-binding protein [Chloroflexota bacterium]MCL5075404.1 FAD-binding protein [Chloroflexota bacterium]